jgi:hypothetical protein
MQGACQNVKGHLRMTADDDDIIVYLMIATF